MLMVIALSILLIAFVLSSVHQAEKIAHHLGEPFGALVLAVSVTIIEVALIISMMLMGKPGNDLIARDTVFSAIMIVMSKKQSMKQCILMIISPSMFG